MGNKTSLEGEVSPTPSSSNDTSPRGVHFDDHDFSKMVLSNKENITLIWLDENMCRHQNSTVGIEDLLKQINNYIVFCTDRETCIQSIKRVQHEKIVLVISGSCSDNVLSKIHDIEQLDSVFVFCMKPERYEPLKMKYTKIVNIYTGQNDLIQELRKTIVALTKQIATFNLFHQNSEKPIRDLTKESAEYLWFQLIKDVLLKMPNTTVESSKQDMIQKFRDYYRGNKYELKNIDLFERTYRPSDAIEWYTKSSSFISRLINKALRIEDIDLLYLFRFFIIDLCRQLKNTVLSRENGINSTIKLYRGLKLSLDEIHKHEKNIGNLISTNGFLSTSRNRQVALAFATNVLFEIETDFDLEGNTWFDIAQYSVIPDEEEVLFDIGATFRIESISFDSQLNLWIINLLTTANKEVANYLQGNNVEILFGELYYHMGNYKASKQYFKDLLRRLKGDSDLNNNNNNDNIPAHTHFVELKRTYDSEIENRTEQHLPDDVSTLAIIAGAYQQDGNYEKAMEVLKRAMELLQGRRN